MPPALVFHGTGSSVRRLSAGICGTVEFGVRPHAHSRIRSWDRSARGICRSAARRILCGPGRIGNSPARIAMVGLELTIALDRLLHLRLLLLERLRCRSGLGLGEKALLASVLQRGWSSGTVARRQGFTGWNHGKISGHHASPVKFFAARHSWSLASGAKTICGNGRDPLTDSLVHGGATQVGISASGAEWSVARKSPARSVVNIRDVGDVRNVRDVDLVEVRAVTPVPGVEPITRSDRQPSHGTESETDPDALAEAEERHIGGRPHRTIGRIHWTRPPDPGTAVDKPAAIVIRSPAPRLVRNPCPAPSRLPHPAAVRIKIFRAHVVPVGVTPGFGVADGAVAIVIPRVPAILRRGWFFLELSLVCRAAHDDHAALFQVSAALGSRNFRLALAHNHLRLAIRIDFHTINSVSLRRMNGDVGRVNFNVSFGALENRVVHQSACDLYLDLGARETGDGRQRVVAEPQDIRLVQLHFSPR